MLKVINERLDLITEGRKLFDPDGGRSVIP